MKTSIWDIAPLIVAATLSVVLAMLTPHGVAWAIILSKRSFNRTLTPIYYYDSDARYVWSKDDFGSVEFYEFHRDHGSRVQNVNEFEVRELKARSGLRLFLDNHSPVWCKARAVGWPWPCVGNFVFGEERFEARREYRGDVSIAGRRLPLFVIDGWNFTRSVIVFFLLWLFLLVTISEYVSQSASHKWCRVQDLFWTWYRSKR